MQIWKSNIMPMRCESEKLLKNAWKFNVYNGKQYEHDRNKSNLQQNVRKICLFVNPNYCMMYWKHSKSSIFNSVLLLICISSTQKRWETEKKRVRVRVRERKQNKRKKIVYAFCTHTHTSCSQKSVCCFLCSNSEQTLANMLWICVKVLWYKSRIYFAIAKHTIDHSIDAYILQNEHKKIFSAYKQREMRTKNSKNIRFVWTQFISHNSNRIRFSNE